MRHSVPSPTLFDATEERKIDSNRMNEVFKMHRRLFGEKCESGKWKEYMGTESKISCTAN